MIVLSELFDEVKKFVRESFGNRYGMVHFERTVFWIRQLKPDADEALLIAAIAHDIERAFSLSGEDQIKKSGYCHIDYIRSHEVEGAKIIGNFLKEQNADKEVIERVKMLISRHEEGGTDDQNLLKDADSISFFENNIPFFLEHKIRDAGKENVRNKFEWMYSRITSKKAKDLAKQWYEKAMKDIEDI